MVSAMDARNCFWGWAVEGDGGRTSGRGYKVFGRGIGWSRCRSSGRPSAETQDEEGFARCMGIDTHRVPLQAIHSRAAKLGG